MIRQLSVFVENTTGSIYQVTSALNEAGINIRAISSFDTPDFGILRLVVDDTARAKEDLTSRGFVVRIHEVIGVELEDRPGSLNALLHTMAENEISINYIYSFIIRNGKAPVMVFSTDGYEKALEALKKESIHIISDDEL